MIELSADLAEGSPREEEIWPLVQAANVACGGHVGDDDSMAEAVRLALSHGVILGAHPSYPDREHFGRRSIDIDERTLRQSLVEQLERLRGLAERSGLRLARVKPHGALYNDAHRDAARARVVVEAVREVDRGLALVCGASSRMAAVAQEAGLAVVREAFADRRYENDGSLVARGQAGALLSIDESTAQARSLARERMVVARDGRQLGIEFDTVCVHADMEGAAERLRAIRAAIR